MASLSTESTPRERLARLLALMKRTRRFRFQAGALAAVGLALALALALHTKRSFRSETTVLYREGMQTREGEGAAARAARLGPKLKDLLYARPELEQVVREHDLFPEKARRSMLDAIEEMQTATGFHARASDSYVISFSYEDPTVARDVAARLAELMIEEYNRQNLDTATLTRDFLRRKQAEADKGVDEASHALAEFLAEHPQFQWGLNDSPYAPTPAPLAAAPLPGRPAARAAAPADPALAELERALVRTESELFAPPAGARPAPLPGAPFVEVQRQRDAAAAALAAAEAALADKLLSVKPAHPDAVSAAAHVQSARSALAAAEATLARAKGGEAPPERPSPGLTPERRDELEARRATLRRQIEARRAALPRAGAVAAETPRPEARDQSVVELETDWHKLRLELDRAREKLHTIQQTARAADLSADAVARQGHEEMQVFEPAYLPTRPDRGHGRVFFVGATLALFVALGYAALRVLLDDTLLDEGDVAALGGPAVLVTMPHMEAPASPPPERAIVPTVRRDDEDDPDAEEAELSAPASAEVTATSQQGLVVRVDREGAHPLVEAVFDDPEVEVIGADLGTDVGQRLGPAGPAALARLRVLRHRLEQRRGDGSFVVTVMSPGLGEGKTTLALRLAVTLSEAERARVILVEGHFEKPRLAAALGLRLPDEAGFSTQLHERMNGRGVAWGVVRLGPSLSLLAEPGDVAAHPEAIHSAHLESALAALRRSYEYVVIDGPGVVGSGDANVLEAVSDGVLLLVRAGATLGAALTRATQQLGDRRVLGVVLNDVVEDARPGAGAR
jgi:Mrp family chromosome partitioning ATPase